MLGYEHYQHHSYILMSSTADNIRDIANDIDKNKQNQSHFEGRFRELENKKKDLERDIANIENHIHDTEKDMARLQREIDDCKSTHRDLEDKHKSAMRKHEEEIKIKK